MPNKMYFVGLALLGPGLGGERSTFETFRMEYVIAESVFFFFLGVSKVE